MILATCDSVAQRAFLDAFINQLGNVSPPEVKQKHLEAPPPWLTPNRVAVTRWRLRYQDILVNCWHQREEVEL